MSKKLKNPKEAPIRNESEVEEITYKEIEYICPKRGLVKQKVRVIKYKPAAKNEIDMIKTGNPMLDESPISELINAYDSEDIE